jgi:hypothetical protein
LRWISSIPSKCSVRQESTKEVHRQTNAHKDRQIHKLKGELHCIDETFDNHHQYKEQEISSKNQSGDKINCDYFAINATL